MEYNCIIQGTRLHFATKVRAVDWWQSDVVLRNLSQDIEDITTRMGGEPRGNRLLEGNIEYRRTSVSTRYCA